MACRALGHFTSGVHPLAASLATCKLLMQLYDKNDDRAINEEEFDLLMDSPEVETEHRSILKLDVSVMF